ncbi:MAG: gas vesicle protein K [Caldilineaceae bacterium]
MYSEQQSGTKMETSDRISGDLALLDEFANEIAKAESVLPRHLNADPEKLEQGLAKLVLAIVDLLRRLMEKQAIRRIEGGSLTDEEIERLGLAFMRMEEKLEEIKAAFGLENEDLNLNLGPLGDLW